MSELTDWQVSAPMPARRDAVARDREVTEELGAGIDSGPGLATNPLHSAPQALLESTQPISLSGLMPAGPPSPPAGDTGGPGKQGETDAPVPVSAIHERARSAPVPTTIAPGDVLCERYVIEDRVEHYGMGHVYKALDRHREAAGSPVPWVALKFARCSVGCGSETSTLLRQEFLKLSQLCHPNIVSVFDIASHDGREFIVMEWLSGETLGDLLARITTKRIALDKALEIVRNTALALAHAHEIGIVHGDVKPSNIFLTDARTVKVLDFGSSGTSTAGVNAERNWATRAYASNDVLEGRQPQPHDDVFALGVTAYCLLSGERPFGELDAMAAREGNVRPVPLPDDALEKWPAVRHALALRAIDRPANARRFLQAFDEGPARAVDAGADDSGPSPAVAYGALSATLLASLVWWSVQSVGGLPPEGEAALAGAHRALAEGKLLEPEAGSAFALYSAVLEAEPQNPLALDGLEEIAKRFLERAREGLAANDVPAAFGNLERARRVSPDHIGIPMVEDLIAGRGRAALLRARQAAGSDLDRAEALLAEASSWLPANDPELARVRDEMDAQRTKNRVGELLQEIDGRILSERLSVPTGDSALDLLRQARELGPEDRRIEVAADRVMTAILFQAMFATSNGDLDEAENFLSMARAMNTRHLALARAEYELAKARRAALSARRNGS